MSTYQKSATWISHSAIEAYRRCPRAYFFRHVYRSPKTGNRIYITRPHLSLGTAVHAALESLSQLPIAERFKIPLTDRYESAWAKVSGRKGGFVSAQEEIAYKARGAHMIANVSENPGILKNSAIKLRMKDHFPLNCLLSEQDNIVLCGKIDWLEYLPQTNSIHIVDFKTGKTVEDDDSLQLPIYLLLTKMSQKRAVSKVSYWYLEHDREPLEMVLPHVEESFNTVLRQARQIKKAREGRLYMCRHGICAECSPYIDVVNGKAEFVASNDSSQDIFLVA